MACNADDIAKIQRTKKLEILRTHPVQLHIELQPLPLPQNMRESGLSMRPQSDYAPGHAHVDRLGRQFIRGFRFVCRGYTFRRVGPIEFMRVGIASLRDDICHLLASLQKLIERLEFQSRSFRRVVRKYNGAILTASRKRLASSGIMRCLGWRYFCPSQWLGPFSQDAEVCATIGSRGSRQISSPFSSL